jgi:hypothetical protein
MEKAKLITWSSNTGKTLKAQAVDINHCYSNNPPILELILKRGPRQSTAIHIPVAAVLRAIAGCGRRTAR